MYSGLVSKCKEVNNIAKQITISDDLYDILNARRFYRGKKYSFNTIILTMVKETLIAASPEALFQHMQWKKITQTLKHLQDDGWYPTYRIQYAHAMRMVLNGQFKECREYLEDNLPDYHEPTDETLPSM